MSTAPRNALPRRAQDGHKLRRPRGAAASSPLALPDGSSTQRMCTRRLKDVQRSHISRYSVASSPLMDRFMPKWQFHRQVLNRLPVRREKRSY